MKAIAYIMLTLMHHQETPPKNQIKQYDQFLESNPGAVKSILTTVLHLYRLVLSLILLYVLDFNEAWKYVGTSK